VKTSTVNVFLDTNILVYAAMGKEEEEAKRARANELIRASDFGTSGQVLQEFYTAVTRKSGSPLTPDEAFAWVEHFAKLPCVSIDALLVIKAIRIAER
jgi:predicted nucleic acid-binding protein